MGKKSQIPKPPQNKQQRRIPEQATQLNRPSSTTLPDNIPEDERLSEMRIDEKKRIFGFRVQSVYYIIWFDRNHSVCPE